MSIQVLKPGLLDSLQDQGRYGYSHWGINPGGAMDRYAATVANYLVGNNGEEAVIEIHFPGPQLLFEETMLISVCGADFSPRINDQPIPLWQPIIVRRNTAMHFDWMNKGGCCYLAIHGGVDIPQWLGSYSTHLKARAGGFMGRRVEKADRLFQGDSSLYYPAWLTDDKDYTILHWGASVKKVYDYPFEIAVTAGREWPLLDDSSKENFIKGSFLIHPSSDRMGYHLKGETMQLEHPVEMISCGVHFGTIQLLPGGQLVALMADHQTTGGYPRIAHVISAHLPKMAQLRPSDSIQFVLTDMATAEHLYFEQERELAILKRSCFDHLKELVC